MQIIWTQYKILTDIDNNFGLFNHIFSVNKNYICSKFIINFLNKYKETKNKEKDIEKILWFQQKILASNSLLEYNWEILDISSLSEEETIGLLNAWDVSIYYSELLWEGRLINDFQLQLIGNEKIIQSFIKFKEELLKEADLSFLPEELAWKTKTYKVIEKEKDNDKQIYSIDKYIKEKNKSQQQITRLKELLKKQEYTPTRSAIRFFLYHFFWFQAFSEERQWTVKLWTIFEPEKYINTEKYKEKGITVKEWWQYDIISAILQGNNTLWLLSTGSWKSITFLLSWMLKPWVTLVVAPLKSLIDDQYTNLEDSFFLNGITWRIHSWMSRDEKKEAENNIKLWKYKFFYCSPERLQIESFLIDICCKEGLQEGKFINQVIIDEAHCLSEWGHDFRFSYLNIKLFKEYINKEKNKIPLIGLTATASQIVKNDIINYLDISYIVEESSLNRKNLSLEIVDIKEPSEKPQVIQKILDEKIDYILWNIAQRKQEKISLISEKSENWYRNAGIIFTIYWTIWIKTSKDSISQSAEGIFRKLKDNYKDPQYLWMFSSDAPNRSPLWCPICNMVDIISIDNKKDWKYKIYYDNINDKYTKKYTETTRGMYETIEHDERFWVCWNPACWWKSFEEENSEKQKPKEIDIIEWAEEKEEPEIERKKKREIEKNNIQNNFKKSKMGLLIATKWFWMGIDKSNIRYIIHATLSGSLESYYQEIWRAWRDKQHSHCILLFSEPNEKCLKETKDMKEPLPCMQNPESFQYQSCPKWLNTMCDFARQQKMIISPITFDKYNEEEWNKKELKFLHEEINTENFINNIEESTIEIAVNRKPEDKRIKDLVNWNASTSFSHSLTEFFQLFYFYTDYIKEIYEENSEIVKLEFKKGRGKPDDSFYEKMIYRLMCVWLFSHYYKSYQGNSIIKFNIKKNRDFHKDIVNGFITEKLKIPLKNQDEAFDTPEYPIFMEWLTKQEKIIQQCWKLVYFTYKKVETQRKEMLLNLYQSIKKSQTSCFREEIIGRLSGLSKKNTNWCWFCSWCIKDTKKFQETNWMLDQDKEIEDENSILKRQFSGEKLTQEEEGKIKQYETKFTLERNIKNLYEEIDTQGKEISSLSKIINLINQNEYNIDPLLQKTFESWTYNPVYYLLDSYFNKNRRKERITKMFEILQNNKLEFEIGQWVGEHEKKDKEIKNILKIIKKQKKDKNHFKIWRIISEWNISAEKLEQILLVNKALKNLTSNIK